MAVPVLSHLRMDNGPESIHLLQQLSSGRCPSTAYIPPASPWENRFVEPFNSPFGDKFLNIELFASLLEVMVLAQHRIEYNVYRPYSALQERTLLEVLQHWGSA